MPDAVALEWSLLCSEEDFAYDIRWVQYFSSVFSSCASSVKGTVLVLERVETT